MTRAARLDHRFVQFVPAELEPGILYVSLEYATAVHTCACGCGSRVVTPLSPADWQVVFDGETVSLTPSVGSWSLPCRSHYWIRRGAVVWAAQWSEERIAGARRSDARDRGDWWSDQGIPGRAPEAAPRAPSRVVASLRRWLGRR